MLCLEKYSGKFILERKPDDKIDPQKIHKKLNVNDWVEYYFTYFEILTIIQNLSNEIKELQNISGPLDFKGFDAYIKRFNDARPDNAVGGTTKDVFGAGISKELSELRRNIYGQFNATYPDEIGRAHV
jgi:hypothetical protein